MYTTNKDRLIAGHIYLCILTHIFQHGKIPIKEKSYELESGVAWEGLQGWCLGRAGGRKRREENDVILFE